VSRIDHTAVARCILGTVDYLTLTKAEQAEVRRELRRQAKGPTVRHGLGQQTRSKPPADKPQCEGHDPRIYTTIAYMSEALKTCEPCTVKDWCLDQVRPQEGFDGVAGGHGWINGRRAT